MPQSEDFLANLSDAGPAAGVDEFLEDQQVDEIAKAIVLPSVNGSLCAGAMLLRDLMSGARY